MESEPSHLDDHGHAHMVDVGAKAESLRTAVAEGGVTMAAATVAKILEGRVPKGDVLAVARVAGIQAAKKTAEIVPLCHPVRITSVSVEVEGGPEGVGIRAAVTALDRTGVEMEALCAVTGAALAVYDMIKGMDRGAEITGVRLLEKTGGRSGTYRRGAD